MIIQFPNSINQAEPAVKPVSADAPKMVTGVIAKPAAPSPEQLKKAADNISKAAEKSDQNLEFQFSMDTDTHKSVVKVTDKQTGELIRQIPSEETIEIARSIDKFQRSLLLSQKA